MSQADPTPDPNDPRRGMRPRPKRGRALLLATFFGLIVLVFLFITLVGQCGMSAQDEALWDPQGTAVVVDDPAPPSTAVRPAATGR
ncbi:hypothetical protein JOD57_004190 [Geodermatophilus bullaregiensis]|uniref:hypothetical protein n=1 Tax=Geodermatophilus bullaregiensis TaxID=1564160 RepID=UPI001957E1C5|nr:hypothetical protein [Geodermatophilus bullaregiensis]MBM7808353.1 hypothetical protein [Geodermatophilus bullaregiensis]